MSLQNEACAQAQDAVDLIMHSSVLNVYEFCHLCSRYIRFRTFRMFIFKWLCYLCRTDQLSITFFLYVSEHAGKGTGNGHGMSRFWWVLPCPVNAVWLMVPYVMLLNVTEITHSGLLARVLQLPIPRIKETSWDQWCWHVRFSFYLLVICDTCKMVLVDLREDWPKFRFCKICCDLIRPEMATLTDGGSKTCCWWRQWLWLGRRHCSGYGFWKFF